jgi:cob(I)alamin adenosyltransferase
LSTKIYTKTGDKGQTSLLGGTRVPKYHQRIEAYGTVDELNSWLGLLRDQDMKEEFKILLIEIQDRLFTIGSALARDPEKLKKSVENPHTLKLPELLEGDVELLERAIDAMNKTLPEMRSFVLPGGHTSVSYCHIARCVCRRAERLTVLLSETTEVEVLVIKYLNRLSDYLFVLARQLSHDLKAVETPWKPRV